MLFNSYGFILAFLPVVLLLYFTANRIASTWGRTVLLLSSVVFISFNGIYHCAVALLSTAINFFFSYMIRHAGNSVQRKCPLTIGILLNVCMLAFFKYSPLFGLHIPQPIGISFYTFQQIAFLVDTFRSPDEQINCMDHALFALFFPKFLQGPIPYGSELLTQFRTSSQNSFCFDNFSKGLYLFAIGLSKKVLLADKFGIFVDFGYQNIASLNSYQALLTILAYSFQLYFDFSGYSDMAVGIGYMFNIELPVNFNSPYRALNISDFWKRWHITLTRFLTKYIYIPLGGNRKGLLRTFINIILVYLVSGLWHGSGFTFLIWGLLHATAAILYRIFKKTYDRIPSTLQWIIQFTFINITWIFFRAGSLSDAFSLLRQLFIGGWSLSIDPVLTESLLQPTIISVLSRIFSFDLAVFLCFVLALVVILLPKNAYNAAHSFQAKPSTWLITYILLVLSILSLAGVSSFLYTNF